MAIPDVHVFTGGMDLDSELRDIKPDRTREATNVRYDDANGSNVGALTNFNGNVNIFNPFIDPDSSWGDVLGSCFDHKRDSVIYFVRSFMNGMNVSGIYSVNFYTKQVKMILQDNYFRVPWNADALNFSRVYRINDAKVIGDMLFWNDTIHRPCKINIEKALAAGTPNGYSVITNAEIAAIKFPPLYPPTGYMFTDAELFMNNLKGHTYMFKYRYVYSDFEKSVCSPESKVITSVNQYEYNGSIKSTIVDNAISLSVNSGSCSVASVEVLCKIGQGGDWFIVKTFDKKKEPIADNIQVIFNFRNDTARLAVDQDEVNRPYDYLPDKADCQEFIDGKYMSYGGVTEGYDNIETDIHLEAEPIQLPIIGVDENTPITPTIAIWGQEGYNFQVFEEWAPDPVTYTREGTVVTVDLGLLAANWSWGDDVTFITKARKHYITTNGYTWEDHDSGDIVAKGNVGSTHVDPDFFISSIIAFINSHYSIVTASRLDPSGLSGELLPANQFAVLPNEYWNRTQHADIRSTFSILFYDGQKVLEVVIGGAKSGDTHLFALEYIMEDGKRTTAQGKDYSVYVPFQTETPLGGLEDSRGRLCHQIKWEINHLPPQGAVAYHWLYGGRAQIGAFKQYMIGAGSGVEAISNGVASDGNSYTFINLSLLNQLTVEPDTLDPPLNVDFPIYASQLTPYIFTKGDRIRFLTQQINRTNPAQANSNRPIGAYITDHLFAPTCLDLEIYGYKKDANGLDTNIIKVQLFDFSGYGIGRGSVVEIYTPIEKSQEVVYRRIGEMYPIVKWVVSNVEAYHGGQIQSQTNLIPATGVFGILDICHILRSYPYKTNIPVGGITPPEVAGQKMFWCESDSFSDFFPSEVRQVTSMNAYVSTASRKYQAIIRRSNPYFEDTQMNGLSTFEFDKYVTLSSRFGRVTAMREIGYTLKILQENKPTSIYIGRNGLKQATENNVEIIVATDNVFNKTNPSEYDYGCKNPESVIVVDRTMYYYDELRKCIVADDPNGPRSISDDAIASAINIMPAYSVVVAGYDPKFKEVYFTGVRPDSTVLYSHKYKNWKCFVNLIGDLGRPPDCYASFPYTLISFQNGRIWEHNAPVSLVPKNNFYGIQYFSKVAIVSNVSPQSVKVFLDVVLNSDKKWTCPDYEDITIPVNGNQPAGMKSRLLAENFVPEEGVWYAALQKNAVTSSFTPNIYDLVNGDDLRGQCIVMAFSNFDTDDVVLNSIIVKFIPSPRTV